MRLIRIIIMGCACLIILSGCFHPESGSIEPYLRKVIDKPNDICVIIWMQNACKYARETDYESAKGASAIDALHNYFLLPIKFDDWLFFPSPIPGSRPLTAHYTIHSR